jgi:hypothetical protein
MRRSMATLFIVSSLLSGGCTHWYRVHPGALEPSTAVVPPDQRSAVWNRAIVVLLDQGYVPQVLSEPACFISAKRREDIADDAFAGTIALFTISPEGRIRLQIAGTGLFHSEDQFLAAVHQRQDFIVSEILRR